MEQWLGELRSPAGERPWRGTNRQVSAGFRLLRRDRTVLVLTLLSALALTAIWVGFYFLDRESGPLGRDADRIFRQLLFGAAWLGAWLLQSLAIACAADAAIDGVAGDARLLAAEVRRRLPALLCLWIVSLCLWYGLAIATRQVVHGYLAGLAVSVVWAMATFFAVPAITLEDGQPLAAGRETLRLLRRRWGRALIGLFLLGLFLAFASIPSGIVFSAATDHHLRDEGADLWGLVAGIALFATAYSATITAHDGFALILARDTLGDLPGEPAVPKPRRRGWVIAKRIALGALALLIALVVLGAILRHNRHHDQPAAPATTPDTIEN